MSPYTSPFNLSECYFGFTQPCGKLSYENEKYKNMTTNEFLQSLGEENELSDKIISLMRAGPWLFDITDSCKYCKPAAISYIIDEQKNLMKKNILQKNTYKLNNLLNNNQDDIKLEDTIRKFINNIDYIFSFTFVNNNLLEIYDFNKELIGTFEKKEKELIFSSENFGGDLGAFRGLENLTELNLKTIKQRIILDQKEITGDISNLYNLLNLEKIFLSYSEFIHGEIDLSMFNKLKHLSLSCYKVKIIKFTKMITGGTLFLDRVQLTDKIDLSGLSELSEIILEDTKFSGNLPRGKLTTLKTFKCGINYVDYKNYNNISQEIINNISDFIFYKGKIVAATLNNKKVRISHNSNNTLSLHEYQ